MTFEDWDDDDIEELADLWNIDFEQAESVIDMADLVMGDIQDGEKPDPDYLEYLADMLDVDVSDMYDMAYGYEPGSHGK